jgi:NAD-dependent deacetylase
MVLTDSVKAIQNSDLVIIAGTSFVVYPFAQLLAYRQATAKSGLSIILLYQLLKMF